MIDAGSLRIVVFAEREWLMTATTRATWVTPAPDRTHDAVAGVRLAPGVALQTRGRDRGALYVFGMAEDVRFVGCIDEHATGIMYLPQPFVGAAGSGHLPQATEVVTPTGDRVAVLDDPDEAGGFMHDVTIGGVRDGFRAVDLRRRSVEVHGVVRAAAYGAEPSGPRYPRRYSRYSASGFFDGAVVRLPRGAGIYTEDGARTGVALAPVRATLVNGDIAGSSPLVEAMLPFGVFGWVRAWLRPSELEGE